MNLRSTACLFFLIATPALALADPTVKIRETPDNRPLPGMIIADTDGFTTAMLQRSIVFFAGDGTTSPSIVMTKLNQSFKWTAPLAGGKTYTIWVTVAGVRQQQSWTATPPDILTLYYPDAEIGAMVDDGRVPAQERILCAKRFNRDMKKFITAAQAQVDRLKDMGLIAVP